MLVTAQHGFHNKLYFFRAFLTYLYLLSFALSEDFLYRADVIYPVEFFLHVIGVPAWALPAMCAVASTLECMLRAHPIPCSAAGTTFAWRCAA
jgi:hypothetical protein